VFYLKSMSTFVKMTMENLSLCTLLCHVGYLTSLSCKSYTFIHNIDIAIIIIAKQS